MTADLEEFANAIILIVDDEETQRLLSRDCLEEEGFRVEEASDGESGLKLIRELRPDLVLLDVMMPGINGFEVCRQLRGDPAISHTPVVIVTGREDMEDIKNGFTAGATDFLTKPVNWNLLPSRIRYVLRTSRLEQRLRVAKEAAEIAGDVLRSHQEELNRQSTLLETTLENMDHGITVLDADLRLLAFNQKCLDLRDYPPGFLRVGMSIEEFYRYKAERGYYGSGDVEAQVAKRIERNRQNKRSRQERVRSDGKIISIIREPMPDGGQVTTYTDITERKKAEEKTRQAMEEAKSANRSKSQFIANMSHELRTPLNAIIGFSDLMMKGGLGPQSSEKYLEYSADVNASAHHLLSLINDILDLSKAESGKFELNEETFDMAVVICSCVKLVKGQARRQGVTLEVEVPDQLLHLYADQRMLKQITLNLLSNAIKFTPEGGKVTLKVWSQPSTGNVLQVIDTGIGVALDDIPRILKPFIQVESDLSRKRQGTGLGLSLCKNFIELHGGYLDFQSEVGAGTTVTVRFPRERIASPRVVGQTSLAV